MQASDTPIPVENRKPPRSALSPINSEGKAIVCGWFNEILTELQEDDAERYSNADCARRGGVDDTLVGDMRRGHKAISVQFLMRQRWAVRRRMLKKLEAFGPRGGDE